MKTDQYRIQTLWKNTKDFLLGAKSKEFLVFLFFFFLSSVFWLLQMLDDTFENELKVSLELVDVPEDVVITSSLPDELRVVVKDKGTALLRYWRHDIAPIQVSFEDYFNGESSGTVRITQSDIQKVVQTRLFSTTRIQTIRPDTLEFFFNHGRHATVPVVMVGDVETNPSFYLSEVQLSPSEVRVFAPASVLDTLTAVRTMPISLKDLKENTIRQVALKPIRGAKVEPSSVKLTARVDVYMEDTVMVPVIALNFPADKQLRTFPSTVKVTYTVGYLHSREISRENFVSAVTYEDLLALRAEGVSKIPVRLRTIPEGVTNVRFEPSEVDYLVETVSGEE